MLFQLRIRRLWPALMAVLLFYTTPSMGLAAGNILATVNNVPITRQEISRETAIIEADTHLRNLAWSRDQIARLGNQLVETLIERELLYQRAQQRNIEIRSPWVDRALQDLKAKIGSTASFDDYLKSVDLTEEKLKERIEKGLIVRRLLHREVIRHIKVSETEMQTFFQKHPEFFVRRDQIRVRQIFIAADRGANASTRAEALLRMQSIQNQLRQGARFAALALEYSEDPSKFKGGDLGYVERRQLIPAFADAAFSLQEGEISDIVETHLGYHLIQMVDRVPSSQMAYRNARTKIERTLRRNKEQAATTAYLSRLKKQANIVR